MKKVMLKPHKSKNDVYLYHHDQNCEKLFCWNPVTFVPVPTGSKGCP